MGSGLFLGDPLANFAEELKAIAALDREEEDPGDLARWLYEHCYTKSILAPDDEPDAEIEDLVSLLAASNHSRAGWEQGWTIDQVLAGGRMLARKNGHARTFAAGEYISSRGPGAGPESEGPVVVFRVSESRTLQPSYYYAFSETICPFEEDTGMLRYYWNIRAAHAPMLMACATRGLNRFQIPFHMKFPVKESSYGRRDAVVLYSHCWYYSITAMVLESVYADIADHLRPETPLFTKELAPGLGIAEDPGESFGQHRCRILAQCLLDHRGQTVDEKLHAFKEAFSQRGFSLDSPWLNAGSANEYRFPFQGT
jgi:hypothetical protein